MGALVWNGLITSYTLELPYCTYVVIILRRRKVVHVWGKLVLKLPKLLNSYSRCNFLMNLLKIKILWGMLVKPKILVRAHGYLSEIQRRKSQNNDRFMVCIPNVYWFICTCWNYILFFNLSSSFKVGEHILIILDMAVILLFY